MENRRSAALAAEFIGTFALVFTIILVVSIYALQADIARGLSFPFIAAAHFLILAMLLQTLGRVSGGHFNPAVSLSLASVRRISIADAGLYSAVQIIGSIAAAGLAYLLIRDIAGVVDYAATRVNEGEVTVGSAFALEAIATFFLVWAIMGTAVSEEGDAKWAPFTIAGTLALGVLLIAPLTGASLNPARSIGPALISGDWGPIDQFLLCYIAAPILGGLLAAFLYKGIAMADDKPAPVPPPE